MSVLYISYDSMLEPLGQSQVIAYLEHLALGRQIHLISFEKAEDWLNLGERERIAVRIAACGIVWHPLRYHKQPTTLATAFDIACGTGLGLWLVLRHRLRIVHARSYVPAVMALVIKRLAGARFIFDMRGFWADEKVEGGSWRQSSRLYRVAKLFERYFITRADVVVSLTHAGVAAMRDFTYLLGHSPRFEVISTCTDLGKFRPIYCGPKEQVGEVQPFVLGCVGSVGLWYLFDRMLECFKILCQLRPNTRLLILNRDNHTYIRERLEANEIPDYLVEIKSVAFTAVVEEMSKMDAGIFFIKPVFSKTGSAPTKLGEFLSCGIPCLANAGVGDYEKILEGDAVGVVLHDFSAQEKEKGVRRLLELAADSDVKNRCVEAAHRHFSLEKGVQSYDRIYRSLTESGS
jgi:glycosyltransferase involved in cell wall biosynthesis